MCDYACLYFIRIFLGNAVHKQCEYSTWNIVIDAYNFVSPISANANVLLERYKRQLSSEELLSLSPEELCKDRISEEYFRLTTEGDCRDVVR